MQSKENNEDDQNPKKLRKNNPALDIGTCSKH
jgi:hypothetical protein